MKRNIICLIIFVILSVNTFSQTLNKISDENPLDCAFDLIKSEDDVEKWDEELSRIADLYWKLGNRKKALEVIEIIPNSDIQVMNLINFAKDLKKENRFAEYKETYLKIFNILKDNNEFDNIWKEQTEYEVVKIVTGLGYSDKMFKEVVLTTSKEDKAFALLAIGEGLAESNQFEKALQLVPQIIQNAELSEWKDLNLLAKVKVGNIYLKANKINDAKILFDKVTANSSSLKKYENIFVDQLYWEMFEAYKAVKLYDDATKILHAYKETNLLNADGYVSRNLIEIYLLNNNLEAKKLMNQLASGSDELDALWVAEKYLEIGDERSALNIFNELNIDYWQQDLAVQTAEYYTKQGKVDFAIDILNQAFFRARKIKSDEPEFAEMSTSPARQKAYFMANIAQQFIKLKRYDLALNVINEIEKPYFKAQSLIKLAENKKTKDSVKLLNQSLLLLQNNKESFLDANKYQIWNELAYTYNNLGQKNKSIEVFSQILQMDRFNREKSLDSKVLSGLAETGYYINKSQIGKNKIITNSLRKIMNIWEEDN